MSRLACIKTSVPTVLQPCKNTSKNIDDFQEKLDSFESKFQMLKKLLMLS